MFPLKIDRLRSGSEATTGQGSDGHRYPGGAASRAEALVRQQEVAAVQVRQTEQLAVARRRSRTAVLVAIAAVVLLDSGGIIGVGAVFGFVSRAPTGLRV